MLKTAVIYAGPSKIDRKPIIGVVTGLNGGSRNPKTGKMSQLWILRSDINPVEAVKRGEDYSICGTCSHRGTGNADRICYVNLMGPNSIFETYREGKYPAIDPRELSRLPKRLPMRLGAYGEPAALPVPILRAIAKNVPRWTGYTHLWKRCHPSYRRWLMASVDNEQEQSQAQSEGWRTFRVREHGQPVLSGEIDCPASEKQGHRLQCTDCYACNGCGPNNTSQRVSITIEVHGKSAGKFSS